MPERLARIIRSLWYCMWLAHFIGLGLIWYGQREFALQLGGGSALIAFGALLGLFAMFSFFTQLLLMSGIRPLERPFGLDRLIRMHHVNGVLGWVFLLGHVPLILLGYGEFTGLGPLAQLREIMGTLPFMASAVIANILLHVVVISSIVIVRRRLKYELWRSVHFLVYAVVILAIFHQLANGQELLSNQLLRLYWVMLFSVALTSVLWRRYIRPLLHYHRHQFRVSKVVQETTGVTSVYITGRYLGYFRYQAGQFAFWHFRAPGFRTQKHPFTISSSPGDPYLRLSAKAIGDYTAQLPQLKKGTPVFINGPYGRFTMAVQTKQKRLFIAGGIGITPIRSMLGEQRLPGDILIYCARAQTDLAFYKEIETWRRTGLRVEYYLAEGTVKSPHMHIGQLDSSSLKHIASDIAERDVWLCGPPGMMDALSKNLLELGVAKTQLHTERFRL